MIDLQEILTDRSKLNSETLPELEELVAKYPFFQLVRLLYVANLYKLHSPSFGSEVRKASVFVPDRTALFAIAEGENYQLPTSPSHPSIETEESDSRTMSLINSFLLDSKASIEVEDITERAQPTIADLTTDYASFLMQQPSVDESAEPTTRRKKTSPRLKGGDLIDNFIEATRGKQRLDIADDDSKEFISPEISVTDEEIYTESMVNIYIKQARYQQALEILRKICASNPKKSTNFAAQIELLEVIIKESKLTNK